MKIYVFGNPFVEEDSLPLKILPQLKKIFPQIEFEVVDPNENFPAKAEKNITVLDTVKGLKKPRILDLADLKNIAKTPISPHDYDLLLHFLLLQKMRKISDVKIIGVPTHHGRDKLVPIKKIISTLILKNERRRTYRDRKHE